MPASVVVAGHDLVLLKQVQQWFTTDRFRVYTNTDIVGVELGGALKNVIAIAAGICDGLGYGDKHRLQLTGIRLLQAEGLPLRRIREIIFGRSLEELREIRERGAADWRERRKAGATGTHWATHELDPEFLLISRRGRTVPLAILTEIKRQLSQLP